MNLNKRFFPGKKEWLDHHIWYPREQKNHELKSSHGKFFLWVSQARIEPGTFGLPVEHAIHWAMEAKGFQAKNSRWSWFYKIHAKLIIFIIIMINFAWIL